MTEGAGLPGPAFEDLGTNVISRGGDIADVGPSRGAIDEEPMGGASVGVSPVDLVLLEPFLNDRLAGQFPVHVMVGVDQTVDSIGEGDLVAGRLPVDRDDPMIKPVAEPSEKRRCVYSRGDIAVAESTGSTLRSPSSARKSHAVTRALEGYGTCQAAL